MKEKKKQPKERGNRRKNGRRLFPLTRLPSVLQPSVLRPSVFLLSVFLLSVFLLPQQTVRTLAAGEIDTSKTVSLTVSCEYDGQPLSDVRFYLYKVANVSADVQFTPTESFKNSGVSFDEINDGMTQSEFEAAADTLTDYIDKNESDISATDSGVTDSNGKLTFPALTSALKPGLYLLTGAQLDTGEKIYTPGSSLVCLPNQNENGVWEYDTVVCPKCEASGQTVNKTVRKIWKDDDYETKRPTEIKVNLLHDGKIYETVTLNSKNKWKYTWKNLSARGKWTVKEQKVPSGYKAVITKDTAGFIITNTYTPPGTPPSNKKNGGSKLPQTGMLWWPVPILAATGTALFLFGWIRHQRNEESDQ